MIIGGATKKKELVTDKVRASSFLVNIKEN